MVARSACSRSVGFLLFRRLPRQREEGGSPDRSLYIVGSSGSPFVGVEEVVALAMWFLVASSFLSGSGGLRVAAARSSFPWCSSLCGSGEFRNPSPDRRWWSIWIVRSLKVKMASGAASSAGRGVGSSVPVSSDYPAAEGLLRIQGVCEAMAAARQSQLWVVAGEVGILVRLICILCFFQDLTVSSLL